MFDWLKYFPYSGSRDYPREPFDIRGPYFAKPKRNRWYFGDSKLIFSAPRANPVFRFCGIDRTIDAKHPGRKNILTANLKRVSGSSDAPISPWLLDFIYQNTWYFVGPWFTGTPASLDANALLASADNRGSFADANLFHPRVFESAIANYLDYAHGYQRTGKKPDFRGPLNWRLIPLSPNITGVVCDIHFIANGGKKNPFIRRLVFIPITPQKFVRISFSFIISGMCKKSEKDKPVFDLCDSIIKSMRLEVGPATQAEWDKVKATCPDMSLTDTFGELPWPLYKEKANKKDNELEFFVVQRPNAHHQLAVIYHRPPAHTNPLLAHQVGAEPLR